LDECTFEYSWQEREGLEYADSMLVKHYSTKSEGNLKRGNTKRLSQSPFAILARVFADVGAIKKR